MELPTKFAGFDKERSSVQAPDGSLPFAPNQYSFVDGERALGEVAARLAPVSHRSVHDPSARGTGEDVPAQEYRRYLESESRKRAYIEEQEQRYRAEKDVQWDMSAGLFGAPRKVQRAARGGKSRLVKLPGRSQGHVGPQPEGLENTTALQVYDREVGRFRFTDGTNDGWNPRGPGAALDDVTRNGVTSMGYYSRSNVRGGNHSARFLRANAKTWGNRFVGADQDARPCRINISPANALNRTLDGYDAKALVPREPLEQPKSIQGFYPLYEIQEEALLAGDGSMHTHEFGGKTYYMPNGVKFYHGDHPPTASIMPVDKKVSGEGNKEGDATGAGQGSKKAATPWGVIAGVGIVAVAGYMLYASMKKERK